MNRVRLSQAGNVVNMEKHFNSDDDGFQQCHHIMHTHISDSKLQVLCFTKLSFFSLSSLFSIPIEFFLRNVRTETEDSSADDCISEKASKWLEQ